MKYPNVLATSHALAALTAATAQACPNCWTARQARAMVSSEQFRHNLGLALAPFVVMALATWLICKWLDRVDAATEDTSWTE